MWTCIDRIDPLRYVFEKALLDTGIRRNVAVVVSSDGRIERAAPDASPDDGEFVRGLALRGMPNLHSHAFQRAMAGMMEAASAERDSFWT